MKFFSPFCALFFVLAIGVAACATDEPRYASPPPGSHSPFSDPNEQDATAAERDRPEPREEVEDEEEPDVPTERN